MHRHENNILKRKSNPKNLKIKNKKGKKKEKQIPWRESEETPDPMRTGASSEATVETRRFIYIFISIFPYKNLENLYKR